MGLGEISFGKVMILEREISFEMAIISLVQCFLAPWLFATLGFRYVIDTFLVVLIHSEKVG